MKWQELLDKGTVYITDEEWELLGSPQYPNSRRRPRRPEPRPIRVTIDVFEQLKCLNILRKMAHWSMAGEDNIFTSALPEEYMFVNYCTEMLRETITCHGDLGISVPTWRWGTTNQTERPPDRMCRRFDDIVNWTVQRGDNTRRRFFGQNSRPSGVTPGVPPAN
ncbi:hypothetical protein QBC41DRAFT_321507 [Cercophora samala]|uniref:Uncharacterized protein n=1 Tax=Cercophora samala TaxID=330535 RepID=A0AA39ZD10_9PEZI|nr:hypothetical protein QBC41DRAFT_321507 [Cercophora samala]